MQDSTRQPLKAVTPSDCTMEGLHVRDSHALVPNWETVLANLQTVPRTELHHCCWSWCTSSPHCCACRADDGSTSGGR